MDWNGLMATVIASLLVAAIVGLVNLWGQVKTLVATVQGHEELNASRFLSLAERIDQVRLCVSPSALAERKKERGRSPE